MRTLIDFRARRNAWQSGWCRGGNSRCLHGSGCPTGFLVLATASHLRRRQSMDSERSTHLLQSSMGNRLRILLVVLALLVVHTGQAQWWNPFQGADGRVSNTFADLPSVSPFTFPPPNRPSNDVDAYFVFCGIAPEGTIQLFGHEEFINRILMRAIRELDAQSRPLERSRFSGQWTGNFSFRGNDYVVRYKPRDTGGLFPQNQTEIQVLRLTL